MPKRKPELKESQSDAGAFFGLTSRAIAQWHKEGCPCQGGPWDLYLLAEWWAENRVAPRVLAKEKKGIKASQDEVLLDAELKRRRIEQQLRSEELDYAERVGELLPRVHVSLVLDTVAAELRKAGEILQKHFGDDAQMVILESLDAVNRIVSESLSSDRKTRVKR